MLKIENRVRHRNPDVDKEKGVMILREIKGDFAICGCNDFDKLHLIYTFPLSELNKSNN